MNSLEAKRHTLAHLLAAAVLERYPHTKLTIGPSIDTGFYYDFDFSGGDVPGENELTQLEASMREMLPSWTDMTGVEVSAEDARDRFAGNPFKLELIEGIVEAKEPITLYTAGTFTDLCRGGHSEHPARDIATDSFSLDRIAGAYWRGDESKPMLTRIYGLAFDTKNGLEKYKAQRENALAHDHRKYGKELDLFTFSPLVGSGLPLWTPNGTLVRRELDTFVQELRSKYGYQPVTIPHITKKDLYEKSGHWQKFADELFRIKTREGKEYAVKPMNCPHHTQIFDRKPHSYKEMPQRYSETTMVYRDEQSGELGGLTRVLSITQDDSHVFCRMNQVKEEFFKIWDIVDTLYSTFGFELKVRLSFHDPKEMDKYLGTEETWEAAEQSLREIAEERNADYFEGVGEAAMYGPKLDFMAMDSMGRKHQVATIQLDMLQPERFDLTCINEKGEKERIVMIHAAIMGSFERFIAVLLEHLGGNLPLWLSPVQVRILPVSDKQASYAEEIRSSLASRGVRADIDSDDSLGKRIRTARLERIPTLVVIGDKEMEAKEVTVENNRTSEKASMSVADFVEETVRRIKERANG